VHRAQQKLFHFQIIRIVVISPCLAFAMPAVRCLDTNDLEMELHQATGVRQQCKTAQEGPFLSGASGDVSG
jgi:hypothetical protein